MSLIFALSPLNPITENTLITVESLKALHRDPTLWFSQLPADMFHGVLQKFILPPGRRKTLVNSKTMEPHQLQIIQFVNECVANPDITGAILFVPRRIGTTTALIHSTLMSPRRDWIVNRREFGNTKTAVCSSFVQDDLVGRSEVHLTWQGGVYDCFVVEDHHGYSPPATLSAGSVIFMDLPIFSQHNYTLFGDLQKRCPQATVVYVVNSLPTTVTSTPFPKNIAKMEFVLSDGSITW